MPCSRFVVVQWLQGSVVLNASAWYHRNMGNRVYIETKSTPKGVECRAWDDYDESSWVLLEHGTTQGEFGLLATAMEANSTLADIVWAAFENESVVELDGNDLDVKEFAAFLEAHQCQQTLDESLPSSSPPRSKSRM